MAAAAFFYAGSLELQWQLLIVVVLLFGSTIAFFTVIFDEPTGEAVRPLISSTTYVNEGDNE